MEVWRLKRVKIRSAYTKWRRSDEFADWFFNRWELQEGRCYYCYDELKLPNRYEVDHKVPIYKGGDNRFGNLCLACKECNRYKSYHRLIPDKRTRKFRHRERELANKLQKSRIIHEYMDAQMFAAIERDK